MRAARSHRCSSTSTGLLRGFDPTQFETKLGAIAAGDPRTFTFTDTDAAGNLSATTSGLRALPSLAEHSLADATQALTTAGFTLGAVERVRSTAATGTVLAPTGVEVLPLEVRPRPHRLGRSRSRTYGFVPDPRSRAVDLPAGRAVDNSGSVVATEPATASVVLRDSRGRRIAAWNRALHAASTSRACACRRPRGTPSFVGPAATHSPGTRKRSRRTAERATG